MKSRRIANLLIIIFVSLLFLEIVLQIAGFFMVIGLSKRNQSQGGYFNILCSGDSFTYGLGAIPEESYPRQLEKLLNNRYPSKHIRVINLGVSGYNSSQCLLKLQASIDTYKPKVIIAMMGMNNCWNFSNSNYFKINQLKYDYPIMFRLQYIDSVMSKSKIYKFLKICFLHAQYAIFVTKQLSSGVSVSNIKHIPLERSSELVDLLRQGKIYYEAGNYSDAELCYQKAMKLSPDDFEPHWYMGRLYIFKGDIDKCRSEFLSALRNAPDSVCVSSILHDMVDESKPIPSNAFKQFRAMVRSFRSEWINKFGEEEVVRLIDPMISQETHLLGVTIFYDCSQTRKLAEKNNAVFFLMTYPNSTSDNFKLPPYIYQRIATHLDLPLIDNYRIFREYLKSYTSRELFVADGHCTAKGYEIIAKNVFEALKKNNLLTAEYAKN